ncbi:unnamed protein product [Phaeothamnion confervicola]
MLEVTAPAEASASDAVVRFSATFGNEKTGSGGGGVGKNAAAGGSGREALAVMGDGSVVFRGGELTIGPAGFWQTTGDAAFAGAVDAAGPLRVAAGGIDLAAGGIAVADGAVNVASSNPRAAVAALASTSPAFTGAVLTLDTAANGACNGGGSGGDDSSSSGGPHLLRAAAAGRPVLDVPVAGPVAVGSGGLDVAAGGVRVGAGGLTVRDGGIDVDGGLRLRSGPLALTSPEGLSVAAGGVQASSADVAAPALTAAVSAPGFGGAVLRLVAGGVNSSAAETFHFIEAAVGEATVPAFAVRGDGRITAAGGVRTGPGGVVEAGGGLVCGGPAVLSRTAVPAGDFIAVRAAAGAYFEIVDDGAAAANELRAEGDAEAGQLMVVRNADAEPTSGAAVIPPGYTVVFVHDGRRWRDLRALESASMALHGVTALRAAADLDIGDFTLRARHLAAAGNAPGRVAIYGGGGVLAGHDDLRWDGAGATLATPRLRAPEMAGDVDFKGFAARNVALANVTVEGLQVLRVERLLLSGAAAAAGCSAAQAGSRGDRGGGGGCGGGAALATFGPRGELMAAPGLRLESADGIGGPGNRSGVNGSVLSVAGLHGHRVLGDVDYGGNTLRNVALDAVRSLTGLRRLEVGVLAVAALGSPDLHRTGGGRGGGGPQAVLACGRGTSGELEACDGLTASIGGGFAVAGTVSASRIKLASAAAAADAENGEAGADATVLAVFDADGELRAASAASGAAGPMLRGGVLYNAKLGSTSLVGDLDLGGHRLINARIEASSLPPPPDAAAFARLTVTDELWLPALGAGGGGSIVGSSGAGGNGGTDVAAATAKLPMLAAGQPAGYQRLLLLGEGGQVRAVGGAALELEAASLLVGAVTADALTVRGGAAVLLGGANLNGGDLRGAGELTAAEVTISGDVTVAGGVSAHNITAASISGFVLRGPVDFAGHTLRNLGRLVMDRRDDGGGGTIDGLERLAVGAGGVDLAGGIRAAGDVSVKGSLAVEGVVVGSGPYVDSSDARLKTAVEPLGGATALRAVRALRGISYEAVKAATAATAAGGGAGNGGAVGGGSGVGDGRDGAGASGARRQLGFLAQELEEVLPELVYTDAAGYRAVAYSRLVPVLAAAVTELAARHDRLQDEVAALRAEKYALRAAAEATNAAARAAEAVAEAAVSATTAAEAADPRGNRNEKGLDAAVAATFMAKGGVEVSRRQEGHAPEKPPQSLPTDAANAAAAVAVEPPSTAELADKVRGLEAQVERLLFLAVGEGSSPRAAAHSNGRG